MLRKVTLRYRKFRIEEFERVRRRGKEDGLACEEEGALAKVSEIQSTSLSHNFQKLNFVIGWWSFLLKPETIMVQHMAWKFLGRLGMLWQ